MMLLHRLEAADAEVKWDGPLFAAMTNVHSDGGGGKLS